MEELDLSYILNHLGEDREQYYNAVSPPIIQSSNFVFPDLAAFREAFSDELEHHVYSRGNNPTVQILRRKLAALERTDDALVFSSGAAAIAAAVIGNVAAGDHIICQMKPYSWTFALLSKFLSRFGVSHTFVDGTRMEHIEAARRPETKVLFLESPNTLTFEIQDLRACSAWARKHGIVTMIDNSFASPLYQQPATLGIDLVIHSGTKYLNGHSDVVVGVVCASKPMIQKLFTSELMTLGAVLSPHDAALVIRGLRTLPLRLEQSSRGAEYLLEKLKKHSKVKQIYHPWHLSDEQTALARAQMSGCGGLFSVDFHAESMEAMERFIHALKYFAMAVSWGGHESLVIPTIGFYDVPGRSNPPFPYTFVRFYIGLEDPAFLWQDLERALEKL
jgi:cystathionine beta-lyase/cystathionine gamma-synthase